MIVKSPVDLGAHPHKFIFNDAKIGPRNLHVSPALPGASQANSLDSMWRVIDEAFFFFLGLLFFKVIQTK